MKESADSALLAERRGPVQWLTLNRPDRLNALTPAMADALADELHRCRHDKSLRVVVLRGAGRAFCAGLDIKSQLDGSTRAGGKGAGLARLPEIICSIWECPQPVIALVQGPACGGGFALALAADIRIAGSSARMNDAFVTLGVSGCELALSYFLPRYIGLSAAAELMYTGRFIDAPRALSLGLVSAMVADDELDQAGEQLVTELLRVAPRALFKTKETLHSLLDCEDLREVIARERATQIECARGPDFEEGLRAFIEKRTPQFRER